MLSRKEFERQYSAELLPSSFENYAIGDIWDWQGGIFGWHLVPEQQNIADVCKDPALLQKLRSVEMMPASLPDIEITKDFKADASLRIPSLNLSLGNVLDVSKIESFKFASVQGRNALGGYRTSMSEAVNTLKTNDFEKYKKYIRKFEVIIALYYANTVEIEVSRTLTNKAEVEAKLKSIDANMKLDLSNEQTYKYKLNSPACPFAAQFEHGRDL